MSVEALKRKVLYQKRKKSGCCPRCGSKMKKTSRFIFCDDCRAFFRGYNQEISETINKDRRAKYNKRKKNNECPRCGKKLPKTYDKKICPKCLAKQYEYNYGKKKKPAKKAVKKAVRKTVKRSKTKK
jgi:Zn finger protein HypA/HybF involved in hydrogenase expression